MVKEHEIVIETNNRIMKQYSNDDITVITSH